MNVLKTTKSVLAVALSRPALDKTLSHLRGTCVYPDGASVRVVRRTIRADGARAEVFVAVVIQATILKGAPS